MLPFGSPNLAWRIGALSEPIMADAISIAADAGEQGQHADPIVTFFRFVPGCQLPMRADRAAAGTMPTRAFRYCEAMTSASGFGWYVFPPITFSLMWDGGSEIFWTYRGRMHGSLSERHNSRVLAPSVGLPPTPSTTARCGSVAKARASARWCGDARSLKRSWRSAENLG
jgi:hypothetical protein